MNAQMRLVTCVFFGESQPSARMVYAAIHRQTLMATATINRLIALFQQSLGALGSTPPMAEIEKLGMVVHRCMGAKTRAYHTTSHVFDLCEGAPPTQTLAALFHDTVYYQLDAGLPGALAPTLSDVVTLTNGELTLPAPSTHQTPSKLPNGGDLLADVVCIFGYRFGQALPAFGGMNEFLSAVAAVRLLAPYLPPQTLLHVAACIESTIAFRPAAADGRSPLEQLHERLCLLLQTPPYLLDAANAHRTALSIVSDAAALANRDVGGFAEADPGVFLSQTWLLIEESNKPLAAAGLYTLQEYRQALQRMDGFLAHLNPAAVFQQFQGTPSTEQLADLARKAHANIAFSVRYLRAKLLPMGVLEALAALTGGDAPISMFLGDFAIAVAPSPLHRTDSATLPIDVDVDAALLQVLAHGRARSSANDLSASPTAAFIYQELGESGLHVQWELTLQYFGGHLPALDFLRQCPRHILVPLLEASAQTALSRRDRLYQLRDALFTA